MTYREALHYLYERLPMFTRIGPPAYKEGLGNIRVLCDKLGNPQQKFKSIHIAGTNGKGSTSHMLAAILQQSGYKTGLCTSPHIYDFRERIRINGLMIEEKAVADFVTGLLPLETEPSFFEMSIAMAFSHFAKESVDVAVIETGLGGRLDSTNIIQPELSVITNIGKDHMDLLGNSLELIAGEKAGIIKENTPVILGESRFETLAVFKGKAKEMSAPLTLAENEFILETGAIKADRLFVKMRNAAAGKTYEMHLASAGIYQTKNVRTVLTAVENLKSRGWHIPDEAIISGIENTAKLTGLQGRWELIGKDPAVIIDVAHNEDGIGRVIDQLHTQYRKSRLHFVLGFVKDKDIANMLRLFPTSANYYFTNAHLERALPHRELKDKAAAAGLQGESFDDINEALAAARRNSRPEDVIMICGSFFILQDLQRQDDAATSSSAPSGK